MLLQVPVVLPQTLDLRFTFYVFGTHSHNSSMSKVLLRGADLWVYQLPFLAHSFPHLRFPLRCAARRSSQTTTSSPPPHVPPPAVQAYGGVCDAGRAHAARAGRAGGERRDGCCVGGGWVGGCAHGVECTEPAQPALSGVLLVVAMVCVRSECGMCRNTSCQLAWLSIWEEPYHYRPSRCPLCDSAPVWPLPCVCASPSLENQRS